MEGNILTGTPYFLNGQQIGFVVWSVFPSKTNGFFEGGNQCHEVVDLDAESQEIGDWPPNRSPQLVIGNLSYISYGGMEVC